MAQIQQKRLIGREKGKPYPGCMGRMVNLFDLNAETGGKMLLTEKAHGEGNVHVRKRADVAKTALDSSCAFDGLAEGNSFPYKSRNSSKPANGMPMKMLIADEMSKETDCRRRSPSVIARLMGLDAFPSQQPAQKQQRKILKNYLQKASGKHLSCPLTNEAYHKQDTSLPVKCSSHKSQFFEKNSKEQQEFKDVFEVWESSKVDKLNNEKLKNLSSQKDMASLKRGETKMAFIRQKFMDAKRLATDENLRQSKEFHDALEVLDSNKDLFLRFLQEPDSLFTKHLHDLQAIPPPPRQSQITVLKSSPKYNHGEIFWKSERKTEGDVKMQKAPLNFPQKLEDCNFSRKQEDCSVRRSKHAIYPSHKSTQSQMDGKAEPCSLPTRIVVLKPSLVKAETAARLVPSPSLLPSLQSDHRKHRQFKKSDDWELFAEVKGWQKTSGNGSGISEEFVRHRPKGSREIAREITRQMRQNVSISSVKLSRSAQNGYVGEDECSYSAAGKDLANDPEIVTRTSGNFNDWNNRFSSSSSHSSESSVSREAKKRLSERWKLMHGIQGSGRVGRSSSTLGEMLTLPEIKSTGKEMGRHLTLDYMIDRDDPSERLVGNEEVERWGFPLGISSRDGWKEGCPRDLQRSRSVPASSTALESPKLCNIGGGPGNKRDLMLKDVIKLRPERPIKGRFFNMKGASSVNRKPNCKRSQSVLSEGGFNHSNMRNSLPAAEIRMSSRDLGNKLEESDLSEQKDVISQSSACARQVEGCIQADECGDLLIPSKSHGELLPEPTTCTSTLPEDGDATAYDQNGLIMEEPTSDHPLSESPDLYTRPQGLNETEPESPGSSKGAADQPSPVSVLEPPFEVDISTPECFERVSADLHGLRMQLQLLKLESTDDGEGSELIVSSDEDCGEETIDDDLAEENGKSLRNSDFAFLLDVLAFSGFCDAADQSTLSWSWYSSDLPVDPSVFNKLEKKYGERDSMRSRSERMLLFDCINSALVEILGQCLDPHPWVKWRVKSLGPVRAGEGLVEEVWRLLVRGEDLRGGGSLEAVLRRDLDRDIGWSELGDVVDAIGREMERVLMDELVEEAVCGLLVS